MSPSHGSKRVFLYIITSGIVVLAYVLFKKKILGLLIVFCSVLFIVFICKYSSVVDIIPESGQFNVKFSEDTEYYSYLENRYSIQDAKTEIIIDGEIYGRGDVIPLTIGKEYTYKLHVGGKNGGGFKEDTIVFDNSFFDDNKISFEQTVYSSDSVYSFSYAKVEVSFERYCSFWDVIFG